MRLIFCWLLVFGAASALADEDNFRPPKDEADLRGWLENMVWRHRFSHDEIHQATGLTEDEIAAALRRFEIRPENKPQRAENDPLLVLPYPGGRHPRIGFLDGAVRPQRETKLSVFLPWDKAGYVVLDVPEAIWHINETGQRELLYLAHTHVPTKWTRLGKPLEKLEWRREQDGSLSIERELPDGVKFGVRARPTKRAAKMEMWITNGSKRTLTGLRVQNCVMLKGAPAFNAQSKDNKVLSEPYVACRSRDGRRWVIAAWESCARAWANPRCPCMHSDPEFPDCPPGATRRLSGWLSFYEGDDVQEEFRRLGAAPWRDR